MQSVLLATKLYIPPARGELIARLNEGLTHHLIVVSAPPGFGKTTLLSAWVRQHHLPTA
jgi:LuxR family maltose regulon positive regulatory protein